MREEKPIKVWKEGQALPRPTGRRTRDGLVLLAVLAGVLLLLCILPVLFSAFDKFHPSTVRRISVGDSRAEVVEVLGEPDEMTANTFEYSGIHFWRIPGSGSLTNEYGPSPTVFDCVDYLTRRWKLPHIRVEFDSFDAVNGLFLDADCPKENVPKRKELKSCSLLTESVLPFTETELWYAAEYTDGSYYMGCADPSFRSEAYGTDQQVSWNDPFGNICTDIVRIGGDEGELFSGEGWSVSADFALSIESQEGLKNFPSGYEVRDLIRSATLAEGIETLPADAFARCGALTEVHLPESLRQIGDSAFESCGSLEIVDLPAGLESIGDRAFSFCNNLPSVILPDGVVSIGAGAFSYCSSMRSVRMPADLQSIGREAFGSCAALEAIDIPDGVTFIGDSAFSGCYALREVRLPEGLTSVNDFLFAQCWNLRQIGLPASVTSIGNNAFMGASLEEIEFPQGLTSVGNDAFSNNLLKEVILPDQVYSIGDGAFMACNQLRQVRLPSGLRSIGTLAFSDCELLESIEFPSGLRELGKRAFWNCSSLRSVDVPGGVKEIGEYTFADCDALEKVVLQEGIVRIGPSAFESCPLRELTLPDTLQVVQSSAFAHCGDGRRFSVTIPASVVEIGSHAFWQSWLDKAIFLQTEGWSLRTDDGGDFELFPAQLDDSASAAVLLYDTYGEYIWKRGN